MPEIRRILIATAALVVAMLPHAAQAMQVKKTFDPEPEYMVEIGHDCHVSIELARAPDPIKSGLAAVIFRRGGACGPNVPDELPAITAILDAVAKDGYRLTDFKTFDLGRIGEPLWQRRVFECYVGRYGMNDRKPHDLKDLHNCSLFRELDALFAKRNAALRYDEMEEAEYLDLRRMKDREYALKLEPQWTEKFRRSRGLVLIGGITYLRIVPLGTTH